MSAETTLVPEAPTTTQITWPDYRMVSVDSLTIDSRYQRHLSRKQVDRIIEHFDPNLFGAIKVSDRGNGKFAVVDGQHRTVAASLKGITEIPAFVSPTSNAQEEAHTYVAVNTFRKATTPYQTWVAAAFSNHLSPEALANEVLAKHNIVVAGPNTKPKTGSEFPNEVVPIKAVGTLKWILDRGGIALLEDTISIVDLHWRGMDNCFADKLIKGLATFLWTYEDKLSWDKLNFALEQELKNVNTVMTPTRILQKASEKTLQGVQPAVVSQMLLRSYNARNKVKTQYRDTRPNKDVYKGFVN